MFSKLKNNKGYIDITLIFVSLIVSIYTIIAFQEPIFKQIYVIYLSHQVVVMVEEDGGISSQTYDYISELTNSLGLSDCNPSFRFSGQISSNNNIQLRDKFNFHYEIDVPITVAAPLILEAYTIDFTLKYDLGGKSQVYFRPGEY